ncbi:uncharacterized protein I303_107070 [Kwoniella dejecticola CBS 10117]|uniref:E3 ubiquitin-protein ligase NRDP1 n=1 Tax=Kwoniella dejecticola CBS 10117 TaxID=1296121 RepID=A0A1A5ZYN4_9TREE|nr:uncharacterized protein I303_06471 [Kwoniella dejecticola CBS 10117]OBR82913.1 hypothetical protein I303_06471 [Kwoniella dejecticola CBS 10117]
MSYEVIYDYVEPIDPNLTCAICQSALVDPVTTTSCKHTFCRDCITKAIAVNPQCPIDRSALSVSSLRDTEQLVKLMLDELKVRCAAEECGAVMERGLLLSHLRSCPKTVVTCQDGDCGLSMSRHRLPHHRAYECFQRNMECKKCGTMLVFKDRKAQKSSECCQSSSAEGKCELCEEIIGHDSLHHRWTCPRVRVACPHVTRGCPAIIPRSELQNHLKTCSFEALSAFFEQNDARFRLLEQKNETLQAEVDLLKTELRSSNSGNGRPPQLWGSRVRPHSFIPEDLSPTAPTAHWLDLAPPQIDVLSEESPSPPTPTVPVNPSGQTLNNDSETTPRLTIPPAQNRHGQTASSPTSPVSPRPSPQTHSASAYPGVTARAAADLAHQRSMVAPSFGSHQSYADWTFNRLSSHNMPNIEDAIMALRDSVLQLAGGIDTMERRNEVRTMTESLRVLEEVGSLRAIVTTMRMQVMMAQHSRAALTRASVPLFSQAVDYQRENTNSSSSDAIRESELQPNYSMSIPITHSHSTQSIEIEQRHGSGAGAGVGEGEGEPVSEDTYLDPERPHSIRESHAFSRTAASSTSSLITAYNATSRNGSGRGRTIGSGAGLTGRTMAIPPPLPHEDASRDGDGARGSFGLEGNVRNGRLSRANPLNLIRRQPSRLNNRPRL